MGEKLLDDEKHNLITFYKDNPLLWNVNPLHDKFVLALVHSQKIFKCIFVGF